MQVRDILAIKGATLYTATPQQTLSEAVATMTENDVGSLVCFEGSRMVGMLTFREVLKVVHKCGAEWLQHPVADAMVGDPSIATPDMMIDDLRRLMIERHQRYLPVMEEGRLLGVLSFHDVAKAVLEEQSFENRMLKAYIRDWPEEKPAVGT